MQKFNMLRSVTEAAMIAIADRFGAVLPDKVINTDILFVPEDLALRTRAEKMGRSWTVEEGKAIPSDKYVLEFINVWLEDVTFSWERQRTAVSRSGIQTNYKDITSGGKEFVEVQQAVPVDVTFTMTLWTKYKERMDDFIQEFMFWQQDNPNIELFYDEDKKLEFDVAIGAHVVQDDLSIKQMYREGKYWKHTFTFKVEAWVIKGIPVRTAKKIILDMYAVMEFPEPIVQLPNDLVLHEEIEGKLLNIALMVTDIHSLTADETAVKVYLVNRGHIVTYLDTITLGVANTYDVVIFGQGWASADLSGLIATTAGVVLLCGNLSLGFGGTPAVAPAVDYIKVETNKHYITQELGLANIEISEATSPIMLGFTHFLNQELELAQYALGACEIGNQLSSGTLAAGRRTIYGNYKFSDANTDGQDIFYRVVRWAGSIENYAEVVEVENAR